MRSFIKGHIRSESSASDCVDQDVENSQQIAHTNASQFQSPNFQLRSQFTSPQNKSISTPKKLLTPIKNLFSSPNHSKQANNVLSSGDRLNGALSGPHKEKPYQLRKEEQKPAFRLSQNGRDHTVDKLKLSCEPEPVLHEWRGQLEHNALETRIPAQTQTPKLNYSTGSGSSWSSPALALSGDIYETSAKNFNNHELSMPPSFSSNLEPLSDPGAKYENSLAPPLNLEEPFDEMDERKLNDSIISIADSKNFETKLVSFQTDSENGDVIENEYDSSRYGHTTISDTQDDDTQEDDEYSDSGSSQFSFVKDNAGGRNTSVKYYKTNKTPRINDKCFPQLNEFNENDLGYEVDELSDYDFENNGMDDNDDFDDDDEQDAHVQYNNIFGDEKEEQQLSLNDYETREINTMASVDSATNHCEEDSTMSSNPFDKTEIETTSTEIKLPDLNLKTHRPFNHSYHLSIEGINDNYKSQESIPRSDIHEEDILENYMDSRRLSSVDGTILNINKKTPDLQSSGNLELFDLNSPMINGLTIGNNLRHRLLRDNDLNEDENLINKNKLFLFRHAYIESGIEEFKHSDEYGRSKGGDRDVFKQRVLKSFHSSISDNLECKISEKINEIESFNKRRTIDSNLNSSSSATNANDVGLGILFEPDAEIKNNDSKSIDQTDKPTPINEIMGLLGALETGKQPSDIGEGLRKNLNEEHNELEKKFDLNEEHNELEKKFDLNEKRNKETRQSVLGMMNVLANLEQSQETMNQKHGYSPEIKGLEQQRRTSIIDMMDKLAVIESQNIPENKTERNSVTNMMATLALLESSDSQNSLNVANTNKPTGKSSTRESRNPLRRITAQAKNENRRYSWYDNDEKINFKAVNLGSSALTNESELTSLNKVATPTETERMDFENGISTLDKDLIDEANQLPEDFNFDDLDYRKYPISPINDTSFLRSNSYTKKPVKSVIDNNLLSSKIETINKTITFYRSNSTGEFSDFDRGGSISRGPSTRSMMSFTSTDSNILNEEVNEDHEGTSHPEIPNGPYTFRSNLPLYSKSTDSYSLDTISEADSPTV